VRHLGFLLGSADGLAGRLSSNSATDGVVPCAEGAPTYSLWEREMDERRGAATLQQMCALPLFLMPGIGPARTNTIVQGALKVPAAFSAAYRATSTLEEVKALLTRLTPPPGCSRFPKNASTDMYLLFVSQEHGGVAVRQ